MNPDNHQHNELAPSTIEDHIPDKYRISTFFGPGLWFAIHTYAANAITPERKTAFIDFMNITAYNIKCEVCRQHAIEYIRDHPPTQMFNLQNPDGQDIGLFKWTWIFHNAVNRRIGKHEMSFDEAYSIFEPQGIVPCLRNCSSPLRQEEYNSQTIPLVYARSHSVIPNRHIHLKARNNMQTTELVYTAKSNTGGLSFNKKFVN